jgi:oligopeptide transport system substrate-binding protein
MLKRFVLLVTLGLVSAVGLNGCKDKKKVEAVAPPETLSAGLKILHVGNGDEVQDIDPHGVEGTIENRVIIALLEGLVSEDPNTLEPTPGMAEKWEISPDGLVYTFHLRPDAKWSNGEPVTATDFVRSYQRMLTPSVASRYSYMLFVAVGARDYLEGRLKDFAQTGFKAVDEHTLQITLVQPTPFLLRAMNHYAWYPLPISTLEKFGGMDKKGTAWTRPGNFVGNGPFVLKSWVQNQKLVVAKSPTYWNHQNVKLDEIHFYPVSSSDTEERMFRTGQLQITHEIPLSKIPLYQREHPDSIRIDPFCGVYFYRFNTTRAPFTDLRVRRALTLAIDRESLVKKVTLGDELPAYHIVPPNLVGYNSRNQVTGDLAEAKRLLAEAGYPDGKGFPRVELLYNTLEKHRIIAEALQEMWRRNLGVEITLHNEEWKTYMDDQNTMNYQVQRAGWIADYLDPHVFLDLWETGNGNNVTGWGNPEYDRLLHASLNAKTNEERYEIYQKMEKILVDELPIMPIFFYTQPRLISPKVIGYYTTPLDNYPWQYVDLKP